MKRDALIKVRQGALPQSGSVSRASMDRQNEMVRWLMMTARIYTSLHGLPYVPWLPLGPTFVCRIEQLTDERAGSAEEMRCPPCVRLVAQ